MPVYLWTRNVARDGGNHFSEFLQIIAKKQMQEDKDTDNMEVNSTDYIALHRYSPYFSFMPTWWLLSGTVSTVL